MPFSKCLRAKIYSNINVYFDPQGCQTLLLKESDPLLFSLGSWTIVPCIDKISSLSCQKVADSITSSKMGNNVAKQASVLLRSIPEYIRRYPSAYCTI